MLNTIEKPQQSLVAIQTTGLSQLDVLDGNASD
jgi:hypothetical protein